MAKHKTKMSRHKYDESKIKTLSSLEHIRLRTGMYIGRTGDGSHYDDGIYVLVKEVIDNGIDEFIMGHGKKIEINLKDGSISVRDYGRGIPLGKVVECVSKINTGAKYNDDVFQFCVGLNGVGTKAVNALSSSFIVRSCRDGKYVHAEFARGKKKKEKKGKTKDKNGTKVIFTPDKKIFPDYVFNREHLLRRLTFYAYLNAGLKIVFDDKTLESANGLVDLIHAETRFEQLYRPFHYRDKMLDLAFTHTNRFGEQYFSFVNGQHTADGGTHQSAFREGILKGINEFARKKYEGDDIRDGLLGAISIRIKDPIFESQTKNKLSNADIRSGLVAHVKDVVADVLHKNPKVAQKMIAKIEETKKIRKEMQTIKKMAKENSRASGVNRHSIYRGAAARSPVNILPKLPCPSIRNPLFVRFTSASAIDASPCGWYCMVCPTTLATLTKRPSSFS